MPTKTKPLVSIVVPVYNEAAGLAWLHDHLTKELSKLPDYVFEIVYVNDGSLDESLAIIKKFKPNSKLRLKVVDLSRNFGKEAALSAGMAATTGQAAICVDADGQFPPQYLKQFLQKWEQGSEVVIGIRGKNHREGVIKRYGSKVFYLLFNKVTGSNMIPGSTDFRLLDRIAIDQFNKFTERSRVNRGLVDWLGYRRDYVYFDAPARQFGKATYNLNKLMQLAINTFISLSAVPLILAGYVGVFCIVVGMFAGLFVLVEQVILNDPWQLAISGTGMLGILTVFLIGLVLAAQGLIGLYVGRVLRESQGRPLYVTRSVKDIND